jgi:hypothetical protein
MDRDRTRPMGSLVGCGHGSCRAETSVMEASQHCLAGNTGCVCRSVLRSCLSRKGQVWWAIRNKGGVWVAADRPVRSWPKC